MQEKLPKLWRQPFLHPIKQKRSALILTETNAEATAATTVADIVVEEALVAVEAMDEDVVATEENKGLNLIPTNFALDVIDKDMISTLVAKPHVKEKGP